MSTLSGAPKKRKREEGSAKSNKRTQGDAADAAANEPRLTVEAIREAALEAERERAANAKAPEGAITFGPANGKKGSDDTYADDDPVHLLKSYWPKPPFRIMLTGAMQAGKTSLLRRMVNNVADDYEFGDGYEGIFDEVHIWSPNLIGDTGWSWLNDGPDPFPLSRLHTTWNRNEVDELIANVGDKRARQIAKGTPEGTAHRALFVVDDAPSLSPKGQSPPFGRGDNTIIDTRHNGISVLLSGQRYNSTVAPITRAMMTAHVYFPGANEADTEMFIKDQMTDDDMTLPTVREKMRLLAKWKPPHHYVVVYRNGKRPGERATWGFGGKHVSTLYAPSAAHSVEE